MDSTACETITLIQFRRYYQSFLNYYFKFTRANLTKFCDCQLTRTGLVFSYNYFTEFKREDFQSSVRLINPNRQLAVKLINLSVTNLSI